MGIAAITSLSVWTIAWNLIKEMVLGLSGKVAFKAITERFLTRLVVYALNKLKDYSENDVVDETLEEIIRALDGKKLTVIDAVLEVDKIVAV